MLFQAFTLAQLIIEIVDFLSLSRNNVLMLALRLSLVRHIVGGHLESSPL